MDKRTNFDNTSAKEPSPTPVELTADEAKEIAGGLTVTVGGITGRVCCTCGIGGPYRET